MKFTGFKLNIMNISDSNNINFNGMKFKAGNGFKVPAGFDCVNKAQQRLHIDTSAGDVYETIVKNSSNNVVASDKSTVKDGVIFLDFMATKPQESGNGLGIITHLTKLIAMLENGFKKIELDAALDTYSFHRKFRYQSHLTNDEIIFAALKKLSACKDPRLADIVKEMKAFLKTPPSDAKTLFQQSNGLINSFIDRANAEGIPHEELPDCTLRMILPRKKALENKDFYNELFRKFQIDYLIA